MDETAGYFIQFVINLGFDKLGKFSGHPAVPVHADGADFDDFKLQLFVRCFRGTALVPFQIQYYKILFRHVCLLVLTMCSVHPTAPFCLTSAPFRTAPRFSAGLPFFPLPLPNQTRKPHHTPGSLPWTAWCSAGCKIPLHPGQIPFSKNNPQ